MMSRKMSNLFVADRTARALRRWNKHDERIEREAFYCGSNS